MSDAAAQKAWDQKWIERLSEGVGGELGWTLEKGALRTPLSEVTVVLKLSLGNTKQMQKHERPKPDEMDVEVRGALVWPSLAKLFGLSAEKAPMLQFVPNGRGPFGVFRTRRQPSVAAMVTLIRAALPPVAEEKAEGFVLTKLLPLLRTRTTQQVAASRANSFMPAPKVDFAALHPGACLGGTPHAARRVAGATNAWLNDWPEKAFGTGGGGTEYRQWLAVGAALGLVGMTRERDALRDTWLLAHAPEQRVGHTPTCGCFGCSEENRVIDLEKKIFG